MEDSRKKEIYKCISLGIFVIVLSIFVFSSRNIQTRINNRELNKNVVITNNSLNTNRTLQGNNTIDYNLINEMELIRQEVDRWN
ncbi:MAG: hypothetical protein J6D03_02700 [Clostridia bacterium]|nr:hypothetical protein [Clostridia bacterium]